MPRPASVVGALALAASIASVVDAFAGDPKPVPKKTVLATEMPAARLRHVPAAKDMKPGESGTVTWYDLRVAADGSVWIDPAAIVTVDPDGAADAGPPVPPKLTRVDAKNYDVDVAGCEEVWSTTWGDGTPFAPKPGAIRLRQVKCGADAPSATMPPRFLGTRLWALKPDQVGWITACRVGVNGNGEGWIDPFYAVRSEPFSDSAGKAVAVTASERDVVKVDITGATYRWQPESPPKYEPILKDKDRDLGGHKRKPFAVTSFTRDGKVFANLPSDFTRPAIRNLKPGESGFAVADGMRVDPHGVVWVDEWLTVEPTQRRDDWGYKTVKLKLLDADTCSLDMAGSTFRWTLAGYTGEKFPAEMQSGNRAFGRRWIKAVDVLEDGRSLGPTLPDRCLAASLWEIAPGGTAYTSCRYLNVDSAMHGFVGGWIPVVKAPFSDDLGPAVALTLGPDALSAIADVSACTHRWSTVGAPDFGPMPGALPDGPRAKNLRVTQFVVDAADAPKPPPAKGK